MTWLHGLSGEICRQERYSKRRRMKHPPAFFFSAPGSFCGRQRASRHPARREHACKNLQPKSGKRDCMPGAEKGAGRPCGAAPGTGIPSPLPRRKLNHAAAGKRRDSMADCHAVPQNDPCFPLGGRRRCPCSALPGGIREGSGSGLPRHSRGGFGCCPRLVSARIRNSRPPVSRGNHPSERP